MLVVSPIPYLGINRFLQSVLYGVQGGRDVILYNVVRSYEVPVAKATVQTKNPRAIVGGTALGVEYCEVVVNHVFMRNAVLPRPYEGVSTILEARGRCIAWPHDRVLCNLSIFLKK